MPRLTEDTAADALAALGNRTRLRLFRVLVKAGRGGMNVGDLQKRLSIPASTLAHHLASLHRAELITQERQGREVISVADYDAIQTLSAFLVEECCCGFADDAVDDVA
ncbi:MAG: transcriptional regulator [Hyphomicrobiales bacterium]|nr:MAG: transcriptional regulator [Hyphomicrobiales bacterium]